KPNIDVTKASNLTPVGQKKPAVLGTKDESLLRVLVMSDATGEESELHFKRMIYDRIDWNDPKHIASINDWKTQIYKRSKLPKAKEVTLWHQDEELWIELFFNLFVIAAMSRHIAKPAYLKMCANFNDFFEGKVVQDRHGNDLAPRPNRNLSSFKAKLTRSCVLIKKRLNVVLQDKKGDVEVYRPRINETMLAEYKRLKQEMQDKGLEIESEYSDNLAEWLEFISNIPSEEDSEWTEIDD
ncbi:hypothetical protein K505DRAFT_201805, partial [Melanomma pulvis-pyrius CBS 109.77]